MNALRLDANQQYHILKNEYDSTRQRLEDQNQLFEKLEQTARIACQEKAANEEETRKVKSENMQLRQNLEDCKTQLFSLQPTFQVTDADVGTM